MIREIELGVKWNRGRFEIAKLGQKRKF
jgi:hypothetical protein